MRDVITIRLHRQRVFQTITVLPTLLIVLLAASFVIMDVTMPSSDNTISSAAAPQAASGVFELEAPMGYPQHGSELNPALFTLQLPPPPLDALPYEVREPLSNGTSVPVKKRWIWLPAGEAIVIEDDAVRVPVGALWWKEFYIETDRGTYLIERRIIARVAQSERHPDGWAFYSAHALPDDLTSVAVVPSTSAEAEAYFFQPTDWLPTQSLSQTLEVRFEDVRDVQYPYVFPGQTQCTVCHTGAAGAYPNPAVDPIQVFGLHPNNLTPESFIAVVARGWMQGGDALLTDEGSEASAEAESFDALTHELVAVIRNNCASCHNAAPGAAAAFTAFVVDPNKNYTSGELLALLETPGHMMVDAYPLVTPGQPEHSEIYLRVMGLEGRRRMPPLEGGLPEVDPRIVDLWEAWIRQAGQSEPDGTATP
ncbi:MAG: hypothetical protein OHK0046_28200 [Anaerolineae bacterium]